MKNCLRIPRVLLPDEGFEQWAVIACDQYTSDRGYWERVAKTVSDAPSSLHMILPEVYLGEDDEARIKEIHDNMYTALEDGWVHKLDRGLVLTERTTSSGTRRGILVCIDLEEYSYEAGADTMVRATEAVVPERLPPRVAVRRGAVLEFPHAMVFYRDKKEKLMRSLSEEDLELLYDFDLMEGGGHIKGYFIPEYIAIDVVQELQRYATPAFAVADGNHSIAAAKALWNEIKPSLSEAECRNHPARFAMVEMVNLYDETIVFHPIHRLMKDVDTEAFCDFFMRAVKCERRGKVLFPRAGDGADCVKKTDDAIATYLTSNEGAVDYVHGNEMINGTVPVGEDCVMIAMQGIEKDDVFTVLKKGKRFPRKTFSLGEAKEKRYYLEGREISYD